MKSPKVAKPVGGNSSILSRANKSKLFRECTQMQDRWTNQRNEKKKRKKRSWQSDRDELI